MNKQPTFGQWFPIALMVGVLAGLSVLFTQQVAAVEGYAWFGAVWVLFISWGFWFAGGAKWKRLPKYIIALGGGVVFGILTLVIWGYVSAFLESIAVGSSAIAGLSLGITVFLAATTIVTLELTNWFEMAFGYFFAYAGYFAYVLGNAGGVSIFNESGAVITDAVVTNAGYYFILLMVGLGFAIINQVLKDMIFKIERVPFDQRNTIFDKEM